MIENCSIDLIINKNTNQPVCSHYTNKPIKFIDATVGQPLKVFYADGSFFNHETVISCDQDDYGFWIETTKKKWKIDWL